MKCKASILDLSETLGPPVKAVLYKIGDNREEAAVTGFTAHEIPFTGQSVLSTYQPDVTECGTIGLE